MIGLITFYVQPLEGESPGGFFVRLKQVNVKFSKSNDFFAID